MKTCFRSFGFPFVDQGWVDEKEISNKKSFLGGSMGGSIKSNRERDVARQKSRAEQRTRAQQDFERKKAEQGGDDKPPWQFW